MVRLLCVIAAFVNFTNIAPRNLYEYRDYCRSNTNTAITNTVSGPYRCLRKKRPPQYVAVHKDAIFRPHNTGRNAYRDISLFIAVVFFADTGLVLRSSGKVPDSEIPIFPQLGFALGVLTSFAQRD